MEVECSYGSPSYICVQPSGTWHWIYTCPDPPRDTGPSDTAPDCSAIADSLAAQMQLARGRCTAVVRLDYQTLAVLSHAFVCGQAADTDEASARKSATAAAVFPYSSGAGTGKLLSGPKDRDQWVFYTHPSDFGGVASVSDDTGLATFAASIVWAGEGEILYPKDFDTADLGRGCATPASIPVRGIDLTGGQAQPRFEEAVDLVLSTALPAATRRYGESENAVVLIYPRTVGDFVPATTEYIVLLNSYLLIR